MKRIIVTLALVVGIVAGLAAFDGWNEHKGRDFEHCQGMMEKNMNRQHDMGGFGWMLESLELTDAQKKKIDELQLKHKKAMIQLDADIEILIVDKISTMQEHDFAKVKKITGSIFDLRKNVAVKQIEHLEAMWNVLTPEQQQKADELRNSKPQPNMRHQEMSDCEKMPNMKNHPKMNKD